MLLGRINRLPIVLAAFGLMFFVSPIQAQTDPEQGDESAASGEAEGSASASAGGEWGGSVQGSTSGDTERQWQSQPSSTPTEVAPVSGNSDHDRMAGNFGIGFFGVESIPFGNPNLDADDIDANNTGALYLSAPTIGLRYWLSSFLGIEGAIGLGIDSRSYGDDADYSMIGFALHGGVPLALASSGHFAFEIIPEINFGVASGSTPGDVDMSGIMFEVGGRVGGEIQFGFIDIPQLSLQGTIGLHFRYEGTSYDDADTSRILFHTSVQGEPWDIFTGSIAAIYYFP